jgi:asparagine synthetase B (glutamine-hydrolysing)
VSYICGILSRQDASLASEENLLAVVEGSGHVPRDELRTFVDASARVALALSYKATFGLDPKVPTWHESATDVAAIAGSIHRDSIAAYKPLDSHYSSAHAAAVLEAFRRGGPDSDFDGVFSLFHWDRASRTLSISTDLLGHRHLYCYEDSARGLVVFANHLRGVLAHPAVPREVDFDAIPLYLATSVVPPPFSLVRGVQKLLPAECVTFGPSSRSARRWYSFELEPGPDTIEHWMERTRYEVAAAVRRTTEGANRIGLYLSGGVDSSLVLACLPKSGLPEVEAFTIAYSGHTDESELASARETADHTGTRLHSVLVSPEQQVTPEVARSVMHQIDEPFESASRLFSEYFLGIAARDRGFDSVVTGQSPGFDYGIPYRTGVFDRPHLSLREKLSVLLMNERARFSSEQMERALLPPVNLDAIRTAALANEVFLDGLDEDRALFLAHRFGYRPLRDTNFQQVLPFSLGIEERNPLRERALVDLSVSIPPKFCGLRAPENERLLFKTVLSALAGEEGSPRKKGAFPSTPLPTWLQRAMLPCIRALEEDGILRPDYLRWLERKLVAGGKRARTEAWFWFVLAYWYREQIRRETVFLT